jgi:hypothetical protein
MRIHLASLLAGHLDRIPVKIEKKTATWVREWEIREAMTAGMVSDPHDRYESREETN